MELRQLAAWSFSSQSSPRSWLDGWLDSPQGPIEYEIDVCIRTVTFLLHGWLHSLLHSCPSPGFSPERV
jgi:hypothetical protein